ncbi:hypothetical protein SAMN05421504_105141 [Amycolatopsis xylanica]|uniref:Uncharacterized protein n=1 Tax=Amycolatopsis xylanica TaxID=589385 RepID=A0A1H3IX49_9PSEU|nr:hypothetical protein [Amycolatopsis xylanica]SDY31869.1 hypothetical protein SAMN05421504_105141 [Amycolatopsis xylanica]
MSTLLLSFAWAVPLSREQSISVFDRGIESGLLSTMDGKFGEDWASAEDFLAHYTEKPRRCVLSGDPLSLEFGESTLPCRVIVTWHPAYHSMTFIVTTPITGGPDLAIAVLQSLQGRVSSGALRGRYRDETHSSAKESVTAAFAELTAGSETEELHRKGWCVEVRGYDGHPPGRTVEADPRPFYGLATSDEGWRFVPRDVAREALGQQWGTRTFVAAYAMANSIVCLNSKGSEYTDHQRELALTLFGETEPYFEIDSPVGGLDHGMLFILERVLIRMALADQWLHRAQEELARSLSNPDGKKAANRKRRLLRGSLDDLLEMLNSVLPPEIDSLERRLVTTMGVERIIQQLDRQAEAMDDETRYSYESVVSARVTRLTVVTVILTVVTIILGVLQVLVSL